jgi:indole-3-glycerol phosphate synthase
MGAVVTDFLVRMAQKSRERSARAEQRCGEAQLLRAAERMPRAPSLILSDEGFDLIAEVKRRSPAMGTLAEDSLPAAEQAERYARAGAAAISVLTEPEQFSGHLADLEQVVARVTSVPAMRKDFLTTPYQIIEARAAGAGGALLVAGMLTPNELREMLALTLKLGMFALVEFFDEAELDSGVPVVDEFVRPVEDRDQPPVLVGVNCRNLRTLEIEFERFGSMANRLPAGFPLVAESGVLIPEHAARVADLGYRLALVGTALMQAEDPRAAAQALLCAGRGAAGAS